MDSGGRRRSSSIVSSSWTKRTSPGHLWMVSCANRPIWKESNIKMKFFPQSPTLHVFPVCSRFFPALFSAVMPFPLVKISRFLQANYIIYVHTLVISYVVSRPFQRLHISCAWPHVWPHCFLCQGVLHAFPRLSDVIAVSLQVANRHWSRACFSRFDLIFCLCRAIDSVKIAVIFFSGQKISVLFDKIDFLYEDEKQAIKRSILWAHRGDHWNPAKVRQCKRVLKVMKET